MNQQSGVVRPKRRKISQACEQCRARKVRCDGVKPVCSECSRRGSSGLDCEYSSRADQDQSHDEYVASLVDRIRELESRSARSVPGTNVNESGPDVVQSLPQAVPGDLGPATKATMFSPGETDHVDAMGSTLEDNAPSSKSSVNYYGASSSVSFLNDVYTMVGHEEPFTRPHDGQQRPRDTSHLTPSHFILPPRSTMDKLLEIYWKKIHHLYTFVHKPTFLAAYEQLWQPAGAASKLPDNGLLGSRPYGSESVIFHCALNIMVALACHFVDPQNEEQTKLATIFGERARKLCHLDLFSEGSLAFIQTLLLIAQYLQSTQFPSRCWTCIGTACRLAQGMGLHVETSGILAQLDEDQIDMRRRVWHGCVMLDTIVSMTLGRPFMIQKHRIPPPSPQRFDVSSSGKTDFFCESIKLYGILRQTVSTLYVDLDCKDVSYDTILAIDSAIDDLETNLPPELRPEKSNSDIHSQQAFVLQTRILNLRVLLYRPIFTRYCRDLASNTQAAQHADKPVSKFAKAISEACVIHAVHLVQSISGSIDRSATGAWWYNIFYVRTACIVILLAMACPSLGGHESLKLGLELCQHVLRKLGKISPRALRCLHELEVLQGHIQRSLRKQVHQQATALQSSNLAIPSTDMAGVDFADLGQTGNPWAESANLGIDFDQDFDWEAFINNPGI